MLVSMYAKEMCSFKNSFLPDLLPTFDQLKNSYVVGGWSKHRWQHRGLILILLGSIIYLVWDEDNALDEIKCSQD